MECAAWHLKHVERPGSAPRSKVDASFSLAFRVWDLWLVQTPRSNEMILKFLRELWLNFELSTLDSPKPETLHLSSHRPSTTTKSMPTCGQEAEYVLGFEGLQDLGVQALGFRLWGLGV